MYVRSDTMKPRPSVRWSNCYFDRLKITVGCWLWLRARKTLYFYCCKVIKKNERTFCKEFCKKLWKKIILGTSDARSMNPSSQRPSVLHILKIVGFLVWCELALTYYLHTWSNLLCLALKLLLGWGEWQRWNLEHQLKWCSLFHLLF